MSPEVLAAVKRLSDDLPKVGEPEFQFFTGSAADLRTVLAAFEAQPAGAVEALQQCRLALSAMLTHMGMDEDEWNRPTFNQARAAIAAAEAISVGDDTPVRDAVAEAMRRQFVKLQRYSFLLDNSGNVRRIADRCGNWVDFEAAHTLFDPVCVDAAVAQQVPEPMIDGWPLYSMLPPPANKQGEVPMPEPVGTVMPEDGSGYVDCVTLAQCRAYGDARASQALARVPEGWRLVPVEPTEAMLDAGNLGYVDVTSGSLRGIWWDMLNAAPTAPAPKEKP